VSPAGIGGLYKGARIILWVEDELTRGYLRELWQDLDIGYRVGGGNDGIVAVAEDAWRSGHGHVFGLRDRDFHTTNRPHWAAPRVQLRTYRLDTHEAECFLLDAAALHGCDQHTGGRSLEQIRQRLEGIASGMVPWMACRAVIAELSQARMDGFPKHPKRSEITNLAEARVYLAGSDWVATTVHDLPRIAGPRNLAERLAHFEAEYQASLQDGSWRMRFSGKEIFNEIRSYINPATSGGDKGIDLAKSVGAWQRDSGAVPGELVELHRSLRQRTGLPT
jgi:hypothetical protein